MLTEHKSNTSLIRTQLVADCHHFLLEPADSLLEDCRHFAIWDIF